MLSPSFNTLLFALMLTASSLLAPKAHAQQSTTDVMRLAAQGDSVAQYDLARLLLFGEGLPQDSAKAIKYFRLSADAGYVKAQSLMGFAYRDGDGVEKDPQQAIAYFEKAARQGDVQAMEEAAKLYDDLMAGTWDPDKRNAWYERAADAGSQLARAELAYKKLMDTGSKSQQGLQDLTRMADSGNTHAMLKLGNALYAGCGVARDRVAAARRYLQAAEAGNVQAMMELAFCYRDGKGVKMDAVQMARWFRQAAENGNANATYYYAQCLSAGHGVEKNTEEAMKWYQQGARQGQSSCLVRIAESLLAGNNPKKDAPRAISLLRQAADLHNGLATTRLGDCYAAGIGVKQDKQQAQQFWALSYKYGNREGAEKYARSLEDYFDHVMQNPRATEADHQRAMEARDMATSIWHDIVRWHDDANPLPLKENPETGDYETDDTLTY